MANTITRTNPGALAAGSGLTFRANLNADRDTVYGHTDQLEREIETCVADYFGDGTLPANAAALYIDNPIAGRVYCPVDYVAIVGGVPVKTTAIISQGYTAAALNHVYLVVSTSGVLSLRVATGAVSEGDNELWIADVTAVPAIDNTPAGKVTALIAASKLAVAIAAAIGGTPTITVAAEAADIIKVTVQLNDSAGNVLTAAHHCLCWLSDAAGGAMTATAPDGGVAIAAFGTLLNEGYADYQIITNSAGKFDLNITESGTPTWYLNVVNQSGRIYSSAAITFA